MRIALSIWIILLSIGLLPAQKPLAIKDVSVVDGTGAAPFRATVLVRGGKIEQVSPGASIPTEANVIDGQGLTLLPGLFDLHTHLPYSSVSGARSDWPKNLAAYLLSGVTTVAEFGTYGETFGAMRELLASGAVAGPRVLFAYRMTTPGGHGAEGGRPDIFSLEALTPREARVAVQRALKYKPDVVKVFTDGWRYGSAPDMSSMEEPTLCALVDEAHKNKLKVLTHTVTLDKAKIAARCRVDVIAHSIGDKEADDELLKLMKQNGTGYVPTLAVYEPRPRDTRTPLLQQVLEPAAFAKLTPLARRGNTLRWGIMTHNVAALHRAGIVVGSGTDAGVTGTHHGWATVRELKLMVESGMKPMEAIRAGTSQSAALLGLEDRGTVKAGQKADLVLVSGKPWERIEDLENVRMVVLDGKLLDTAALARMVAGDAMSVIAPRPVAARLDDFEGADGLSSIGTLWVNGSDGGHDRSRVMFARTLRKPGNHALSLIGRFAEKDKPFLRMSLPLHPGGVVPADLSSFKGVRFDVRGEGAYRLLAMQRARGAAAADFDAQGKWRTIKIDFDSFAGEPLERKDILMLSFEASRAPGEPVWMEIDNVRLY